MDWYNVKEKSAGVKRLKLCGILYKIFGKSPVILIAFFVALVTILTNKDLKISGDAYFSALFEFTGNKKFKPSFFNNFRRVLNYSLSLADKIEIFSGKFNTSKIIFDNEKEKEDFFNFRKIGTGVFYIFTHIGNIDAIRPLTGKDTKISIFLLKNHCKIFNEFTNTLGNCFENFKTYPVENIDVNTVFETENDLKEGAAVFMAGDRISAFGRKTYSVQILGKNVKLPQGTFRFAKLQNCPIYFISCLKEKGKYKVYLQESEEDIVNSYSNFLENLILKQPYQFYHFYDFFAVE